ncbi:hypothetical protein JW935_28170 [candidate division KSB1 bacterium]|nr:hypothetical protein [candidate division KSB1 bacterium]
MNTGFVPNRAHRRLMHRRKLLVAGVIAAVFFFLTAFNLGSYLFYKQLGNHLEQSLNMKMRTAAELASYLIGNYLPDDIYDISGYYMIRPILSRIHERQDFEAVYLIDRRYNVLVESSQLLEFATSRGYLREDSTAISLALEDSVTTSQLHIVEDNIFKSVYAPVYNVFGETVILVMEANVDFLQIIAIFRRGLYIGAVISMLLLGLVSIFLILATSLFLKTETKLFESQRLASMGQMAATVAHEIRNPLGIIKSTSDLLKEEYYDRENPNELWNYINDEIKRLNRLVNDFLALSREPKLVQTETDLGQLLQDAVSTFRTDNNLTVNLIAPPPNLRIYCDADKIHQVVLNLLLNAAQAMEDRPGEIVLESDIVKRKGRTIVRVRIRDDGPGISGDPQLIFEPFFTTKTRGTGLGLAVSKSIIEKHGGEISAGNRPEGGTEFVFWLPVKN